MAGEGAPRQKRPNLAKEAAAWIFGIAVLTGLSIASFISGNPHQEQKPIIIRDDGSNIRV